MFASVRLIRDRSVRNVRTISATAVQRTCTGDTPTGWDTARPFGAIPGPTKLELIRWFLPGGPMHGRDAMHLQGHLHDRYGPITRLPGILGKRDTIYSFDPQHFEIVFRTEGVWPVRRSLDTFEYYRQRVRPEVFKGLAGLVNGQGKPWQKLRTAVNPVMTSPRTCRSYVAGMETVAAEFVDRMRQQRDANGELPADFSNQLGLWSLESIGLIALDRRLGALTAKRGDDADMLINVC